MSETLLHTLADLRPWPLAALARHLKRSEAETRAQLAALQQSGTVPLLETADGWQMRPALALLDAAWLQRECPAAAVQVLTVTDSTNSALMRETARANGDAILAEYQSAGRGRRDRAWQSPFAGQIILSMSWHYPDPQAATALSIALGIAAASTLRATGYPIQLKWPNDLYLHQRKLGGILVEASHHAHGVDIIAGIGINLLPLPGLDQPAAIPLTALPCPPAGAHLIPTPTAPSACTAPTTPSTASTVALTNRDDCCLKAKTASTPGAKAKPACARNPLHPPPQQEQP